MNIKKIILRYFINGYLVSVIVLTMDTLMTGRCVSTLRILLSSFPLGLIFWVLTEMIKKRIMETKEDWKESTLIGKIIIIISVILLLYRCYIKISSV